MTPTPKSVPVPRSQTKSLIEWIQQHGDDADRNVLKNSSFDDIEIDKSYTGPHLSFPLSAVHVNLLIDNFKLGYKLHAKYLLQLLHEARLVLKAKPNISQVSTSESKQVTIVGDLHGYLTELLTVFDKNGLPDVKNPYIFNGDFVDRGPKSVEVLALLLSCLLVWPTAVHLNRGNHEDSSMNDDFGFTEEVQRKYRRYGNRILDLFEDLCAWLPLAALIDNRALVTHGGVSEKLDLELVKQLDRHKFVTLLDNENTSKEQEAVEELLWNDPRLEPGSEPGDRGCGKFFGPDATADFLKRHGLSLIVRSHECFAEGFDFCHDRKVLTIFSISNYHAKNKGAIVKFDSKGEPQFIQYQTSGETCRARGRRVDPALRKLRVLNAASELVAAVDHFDAGPEGTNQWSSIITASLQSRSRSR